MILQLLSNFVFVFWMVWSNDWFGFRASALLILTRYCDLILFLSIFDFFRKFDIFLWYYFCSPFWYSLNTKLATVSNDAKHFLIGLFNRYGFATYVFLACLIRYFIRISDLCFNFVFVLLIFEAIHVLVFALQFC